MSAGSTIAAHTYAWDSHRKRDIAVCRTRTNSRADSSHCLYRCFCTFKKACLTFFIYITGAWTDAQDLISNIKTGCLCLIYCCLKFFFHISQIYFSVRAELI